MRVYFMLTVYTTWTMTFANGAKCAQHVLRKLTATIKGLAVAAMSRYCMYNRLDVPHTPFLM